MSDDFVVDTLNDVFSGKDKFPLNIAELTWIDPTREGVQFYARRDGAQYEVFIEFDTCPFQRLESRMLGCSPIILVLVDNTRPLYRVAVTASNQASLLAKVAKIMKLIDLLVKYETKVDDATEMLNFTGEVMDLGFTWTRYNL